MIITAFTGLLFLPDKSDQTEPFRWTGAFYKLSTL